MAGSNKLLQFSTAYNSSKRDLGYPQGLFDSKIIGVIEALPAAVG
jgi:hypothetical protein